MDRQLDVLAAEHAAAAGHKDVAHQRFTQVTLQMKMRMLYDLAASVKAIRPLPAMLMPIAPPIMTRTLLTSLDAAAWNAATPIDAQLDDGVLTATIPPHSYHCTMRAITKLLGP